jgi:hypothetical protein
MKPNGADGHPMVKIVLSRKNGKTHRMAALLEAMKAQGVEFQIEYFEDLSDNGIKPSRIIVDELTLAKARYGEIPVDFTVDFTRRKPV